MWEDAGGYVCAVNICLRIDVVTGMRFFCSTHWDKLCKVQVIFALLFSLTPIALTSVVEFLPPLLPLSTVIPVGIEVWLGNEGGHEFFPYVFIPCFCNKTLSEVIAMASRKRMKMQDCSLLWMQIATWTVQICLYYTSTSVMLFWNSVSDSCCLIAVHLPGKNIFI